MTMTANEYRKVAYKTSKYHSKKTECLHGHTHDSRTEAHRCDFLHQMQDMGKIDHLQIQRKYVLIPAQREKGHGFYTKGKKKGQAKTVKIKK